MKTKILRFILNSSLTLWVIRLLIKIKFKKYENVSLYEVINIFFDKITKDEIMERASGVAFNFTLSIFPAIIFVFTLIPYIHNFIPEVGTASILAFIGNFMPESMWVVMSETIEDIIGKERGGLLTFGAVFALYLAANGVMSLMGAFNACYKTVENRGFFRTRLTAIGLTIMLAFTLILAIILLVVGEIAIDFVHSITWLEETSNYINLFIVLRFFVIFIVFFLAISFIYYFGPSIHYNWRFFSIGSVLATFLSLATSYGFSYYITNFGTYNKLYGSIGVMIALMIWQFIISVIILVGYELNASLHQAHRVIGDEPKINLNF